MSSSFQTGRQLVVVLGTETTFPNLTVITHMSGEKRDKGAGQGGVCGVSKDQLVKLAVFLWIRVTLMSQHALGMTTCCSWLA